MKGVLVAAVACIGGSASDAWACPISGKVVCASDPSKGVANVGVSVSAGGWLQDETTTDANGNFSSVTLDADATFVVALSTGEVYDPAGFCHAWGLPVSLEPFEIDAPGCTAPPPPPPPECRVLDGLTPGPFCLQKGYGSMKSECAAFGLVPLDKDDGLSGQTFTATTSAPLALVKAGNCYNIHLGVIAGVTQLNAPYTQAISHVTYCTCE